MFFLFLFSAFTRPLLFWFFFLSLFVPSISEKYFCLFFIPNLVFAFVCVCVCWGKCVQLRIRPFEITKTNWKHHFGVWFIPLLYRTHSISIHKKIHFHSQVATWTVIEWVERKWLVARRFYFPSHTAKCQTFTLPPNRIQRVLLPCVNSFWCIIIIHIWAQIRTKAGYGNAPK